MAITQSTKTCHVLDVSSYFSYVRTSHSTSIQRTKFFYIHWVSKDPPTFTTQTNYNDQLMIVVTNIICRERKSNNVLRAKRVFDFARADKSLNHVLHYCSTRLLARFYDGWRVLPLTQLRQSEDASRSKSSSHHVAFCEIYKVLVLVGNTSRCSIVRHSTFINYWP